MTKDIDTSILRAFIAVAETGTITGAARLLNRTQAAVSQQIKRLEQHFDVELFHREHKRVSLAPDGERLLGAAQRLLSLNDETWGMMTTPSFRGEVRFGIPTDLVATYAPSILRRFNAAWPQVRVSIETGSSQTLIDLLDSGKVDLTLTTDNHTLRRCETLYRDRLHWVAARYSMAYLDRPLPIATGGNSCCFRPSTFEALNNTGIEWRITIEVENQEAMCAPVKAGLAVTVLLADSVPEDIAIVPSDSGLPELPDFNINLHLPRSGATDIANALAENIRADFAARYGTEDQWSARPRHAA